jgi:hypothetical protein
MHLYLKRAGTRNRRVKCVCKYPFMAQGCTCETENLAW